MSNDSREAPRCPGSGAWDAFLAGLLPSETVHELEHHLEGCEQCVAQLWKATPPPPRLLKDAAREPTLLAESDEVWYLRLRTALPAVFPDDATISALDTDRSIGVAVESAPPTYVGDYELLNCIGRGGMGVVYRARQIKLQREVAVKMLPAHSDQSSPAMDRLVEEARRLAQIHHPNIVQVFDVGEFKGVPFFSMELVEGMTLARVARQAPPWSPQIIARLMATVADAVHAAHQAGVIHRDLKPSNVILSKTSEPKVTDFGLATNRDQCLAASGDHAANCIAGTAEYMAPEQWAGDPELIGVRTDVYGLGTILYELLTGRPPFPRDRQTATTRERVFKEPPASLRKVRPTVPRDLEAIVLRCLAKIPSERYSSAADLAADLRQFLALRPVLARPAGIVRRARYAIRRNWLVLASAMAVLIVAGAAAAHFARTITEERNTAHANQLFDDGVHAASTGAIRDGAAKIREAIAALPATKHVNRRYFQQTLARWEMFQSQEVAQFPPNATNILAAVVSPDGTSALWSDESGAVQLASLPAKSIRILASGTRQERGKIRPITFNRSGSRCAAGIDDTTIRIWDVETGAVLGECRSERARFGKAAFLGDDQLITASAGAPATVQFWATETPPFGPDWLPSLRIESAVESLLSSPDGTGFIAIGISGRAWLYNRTGSDRDDLAQIAGGLIHCAAYSPDAMTIALGGAAVSLFEVPTKRIRQSTGPLLGMTAKAIQFRSDGSLSALLEGSQPSVVRQMTPDLTSWDDIPISAAQARLCRGPNNSMLIVSGLAGNQLQLRELPKMNRRSIRVAESAASGGRIVAAHGHVLCLSHDVTPTETASILIRKDRPIAPLRRFQVSLWNRENMQRLALSRVLPEGRVPYTIAFGANSNDIAIGCEATATGGAVLLGTPAEDGSIRIEPLGFHACDVNSLVFSADRKALFSGSFRQSDDSVPAEIVRWSLASRSQERRREFPASIQAIALSADDRWLAVGDGNGGLTVLSADDLSDIPGMHETLGGAITTVAFGNRDSVLAAGDSKGNLGVFQIASQRLVKLADLQCGLSDIRAARFGPDDRSIYVASCLRDAPISAWNIELGRQIGPAFPSSGVLVDFAVDLSVPAIVALYGNGQMTMFSIPPKR